MQNNIETIINNALLVNKFDDNHYNIKQIIEQIKKIIIADQENLFKANQIDLNNHNGFKIELSFMENILNKVLEEKLIYGLVTLSQKNDQEKIMYGKQIMDKGIIALINDGNSYVIFEMLLRNLLAFNTVIFNNNGYMYGTNNYLIQLIQNVLIQNNYPNNLFQLIVSKNPDNLLNNYASFDLVIVIGNHNLQRIVIEKSKNIVLSSGYEHFDLYIENIKHKEFIAKILSLNLSINVYVKEGLDFDVPNAMLVSDIDEAIAQINYNGNKYSCSIFTEDEQNASKFIKNVKSKNITVNTSPTIERVCDLDQKQLCNEKTIIHPINFMIDSKDQEKN